MSTEQNIGDFLKRLMDSVPSDQLGADTEADYESTPSISNEDLQAQLKNQYIDGTEVVENDATDTSDNYFIDNDFLADAVISEENDAAYNAQIEEIAEVPPEAEEEPEVYSDFEKSAELCKELENR